MYKFDQVESRRGTHSVMWDGIEEKCGRPSEEILPAWIADMDFPSDPQIVEELVKRISTGYLGYAGDHRGYKDAYISWMERRHGLSIEIEDLGLIPGVKVGMNASLESLGKPGDGVIIQTPVYDPFGGIVEEREMVVVKNPLVNREGHYTMNLEELERLAVEENNKFIILCNPHNPVGRVWTREELTKVGEICLKNGITIISDEMYSDLTMKKYTPMSSISKEIEDITVTLTSPSKTFNIMSFNIANLICKNHRMKEKILKKVLGTGHGHLNLGGLIAGEAAYKNSLKWVEEVMEYIGENHRVFKEIIESELLGSIVSPAEGGFLAWVDVRPLGLESAEVEKRLLERGDLLVGQGYIYGEEGDGFIRVNLGGTREKIEDIAKRIIESLK